WSARRFSKICSDNPAASGVAGHRLRASSRSSGADPCPFAFGTQVCPGYDVDRQKHGGRKPIRSDDFSHFPGPVSAEAGTVVRTRTGVARVSINGNVITWLLAFGNADIEPQ